jgi:hypothetical protein
MINHKDLSQPEAVQTGTGGICEDEIDLILMGTFPASDPPSWTLGITHREKWPGGKESSFKDQPEE